MQVVSRDCSLRSKRADSNGNPAKDGERKLQLVSERRQRGPPRAAHVQGHGLVSSVEFKSAESACLAVPCLQNLLCGRPSSHINNAYEE